MFPKVAQILANAAMMFILVQKWPNIWSTVVRKIAQSGHTTLDKNRPFLNNFILTFSSKTAYYL